MAPNPISDQFADVLIVGGGVAGLSAALMLGRCRRRVVLVDRGNPRNATADTAHGLLLAEGRPPGVIVEQSRAQLDGYDVKVIDDEVISARRAGDHFTAVVRSGASVLAHRLLIACGVDDMLPEVAGLAERWGKSVFHCPYCHGWEQRDAPIGLYGRGEEGYRLAGLMREWSHDLVLFTDGPHGLAATEHDRLKQLDITVRQEGVLEIRGDGTRLEEVVLESGEVVARTALFLKPHPLPRIDLAVSLGCALSAKGFPEVDHTGATSVPGVFAAGDLGLHTHMLATAAASGVEAAIAINDDLVREAFFTELEETGDHG